MRADGGGGAQAGRLSGWAQRCTAEMAASGIAYISSIPGAQTWRVGAYHAFVCGQPFPPFNGVMATGPGDVADLDAALDRVVASGLPHLLRMRHGLDPAADARLVERGYQRVETDPAMVLVDAAGLAVPDVPGLVVEQVHGAGGLAEHLDVFCDAFESPRELTAAVVTPQLVADPAARFYVGRVDGQPVTTASSYRTGDSVGVYSVGTPIALRGNGYGSAITARAVADGVRDGAGWAYLMSSTLGYGPYERLGFVTVDEWDLWVPGGP